MTLRGKLEIVGAVIALLLVVNASVQANGLRDDLRAAERTRDSLAIEAAANRAEADGWSVRFAEETENLAQQLAHRDSQARDLTNSLRRANAKVLSLMDVVASLKDSLTSVGVPTDTSEAGEVTYHGEIADGLLTASWRFLVPELALQYSVAVPLEIVTSEGGDGRWLVTARSKDPRASVSVPGYWFNAPEAVTLSRCSIRQRVTAGLLGVVAGYGVAR